MWAQTAKVARGGGAKAGYAYLWHINTLRT